VAVLRTIVIVGASIAGLRAAEAFRRDGYDGRLALIGDERHLPYDRPPLSKELLGGGGPDPLFRVPEWYAERSIELLLGRSAVALDPVARRVRLDDRSILGYDDLIVATGAHARRLPGLAGRPNVHVLRSLADARRLRGALLPGARVAIVGAGFIGQEVAATARRLGASVTLVEAAASPLEAVLGARLGAWFADLHRAEGVEVHVGTTVTEAMPVVAGEPVRELRLEPLSAGSPRTIGVDAVLVAIGVSAETRWLAGTPLAGGPIAVDAGARTSVPHVFAAGDVVAGCEHWEPAARLGTAAARSILGLPVAAAPPASFWSDQYGVRIHLVGEAAGADSIEIDGRPDARDFTAVLHRRGRLTGALLVGRPRELPGWRRALSEALTPERSAA
jgi:3-phenylpropionate/trans-cinnamate dioxygenase ferredoxin reductase component